MEAYFALDKDQLGGFYDVFCAMPDNVVLNEQRNTIQEVRHGSLPDDVMTNIESAVTKPDPVSHYDNIFKPYFDMATVIWTREGGFVN